MRQFMLWLAVLLTALLLLYAGLNVVEQSMHELLALERPPAAFTLRRGLDGTFILTFSGSTYLLDFRQILEEIKAWGARLSFNP